MIAPGVLATVAHVLYRNKGDSTSFQDSIQTMRVPELGRAQQMETAIVMAIDAEYDIGLLKIENPRTTTAVTLATDPLLVGTEVGAVGFPLMNIRAVRTGVALPIPRFQGGHVSVSYSMRSPTSGRQLAYHETDVPMYKGSSGCPGFLAEGVVFGVHVAEWHDGGGDEDPGQRAFSMRAPASAIISLAHEHDISV
jgi:S1-C subfamily serine protease